MPTILGESAGTPKIDGDNRYLWRMNRARLDGEEVRDAIAFVTGKARSPHGRSRRTSNSFSKTTIPPSTTTRASMSTARKLSPQRLPFHCAQRAGPINGASGLSRPVDSHAQSET